MALDPSSTARPYAGQNELYGTQIMLVQMLQQFLKKSNSIVSEQFTYFMQVLAEEMKTGLLRSQISMHTELAKGAQRAMLTQYLIALAASGKNTPPDRISNLADERNRRYAGGALERALASSDMAIGTYQGVYLYNEEALDLQARQWHRLNFGASPGSGSAPRRFNVNFQGQVMAALGLEDGPSKSFSIPTGYWVNGSFWPTVEYKNTFYKGSTRLVGGVPMSTGEGTLSRKGLLVRKQKGPHTTRGITAWHFLDAGVEYLAEHFPEAYQAQFDQQVARFKAGKATGFRRFGIPVAGALFPGGTSVDTFGGL